MKTFIIAFSLLLTNVATADQGCVALAKYVGSYKQVSKTCDAFGFGSTLTVEPYNGSKYSGYWITSGSIAFGPSTRTDGTDLDKCIDQGNNVIVQICGNARNNSCLPFKGRISYVFSGSQVNFQADGCNAVFAKQ